MCVASLYVMREQWCSLNPVMVQTSLHIYKNVYCTVNVRQLNCGTATLVFPRDSPVFRAVQTDN